MTILHFKMIVSHLNILKSNYHRKKYFCLNACSHIVYPIAVLIASN